MPGQRGRDRLPVGAVGLADRAAASGPGHEYVGESGNRVIQVNSLMTVAAFSQWLGLGEPVAAPAEPRHIVAQQP